jgi:hypothetical protein
MHQERQEWQKGQRRKGKAGMQGQYTAREEAKRNELTVEC